MKIVTDSTPVEEPKDPDKCNVFALLKLVASPEELAYFAKLRATNAPTDNDELEETVSSWRDDSRGRGADR